MTNANMTAAIGAALFTDNINHKVSCPQGNCTFGSLTTLGVCSAVRDVTRESTRRCDIDHEIVAVCQYSLPLGANLTSLRGAVGSPEMTRWNATTRMDSSFDWSPSPRDASLVQFAAIHQKPQDSGSSGTAWTAWQIDLFWCELTYNSLSVINGRPSLPEPTERYMTEYNPDGTYILEERTLRYELTEQTSDSPELYSINKFQHWYLQDYFEEMFNAGWVSGPLGQTWEYSDFVPSALSMGQHIYSSNDVPKSIRRLAESMREAVRTSPAMCDVEEPCIVADDGTKMSVNSVATPGHAYSDKAYIQVRWTWLALPIGLVMLSTFLLVLVIFTTDQNMAWKSSGTAAFFYRLQGWEYDEVTVSSPEGMLARPENLRGRMVEEDGTLYFIRPKEED